MIANATHASAVGAKLSANGQMDFVYGPTVDDGGGRGTTYKPESGKARSDAQENSGAADEKGGSKSATGNPANAGQE